MINLQKLKIVNLNILDIYLIIIYSLLPISLILGNLIINVNILIIGITLIIYCYKNNIWYWTNSLQFKLLIIIQIYLILSSLNAYYNLGFNDNFDGIFRSISFIKYILLFFSFKILIKKEYIFKNFLKIWLFISLIVLLDIFFEKITGSNIFGFHSIDPRRIASFFRDELVVGGYILLIGYYSIVQLLDNLKKENIYKFIFNILIFLIPIAIFISGERSNFIKSIIIFTALLLFINNDKFYLNKIFIIIILISSFGFSMMINKDLKNRYMEFFNRINIENQNSNLSEKFENIKYIVHYKTAFKIFKNYPYLGIGSKNFRNECSKDIYNNEKDKLTHLRCSTHPHNTHFELLSEQGIIGYILTFSFIIYFLFSCFKTWIIKKDYLILFGSFYILTFFIPLLPGGSIFSTFNGTLFWLIFGLTNYRLSN
mgnify:CR=1 FL=1|tara:strand:- start:1512 stop:2792 length:1281 start_codon:yes stop_codon:yes gene_type:complete